jgi:methyltransferase (TIGR00027 family)
MTSIDDVSDTALWVANYRALESERPDALFSDPLAAILVGERGRQIAKIMAWIMVVRTTAIDELIEKAVKNGVDTVLNLGAGLDTRPYRMKLPASLRWIEVDFPKMITQKDEKLRNEKPVCRLERVAMDLSDRAKRQEFFARLGGEGGNVLVITEGVIPYLSNEAAAMLAQDLSAIPTFQFWVQDFHNQRIRSSLNLRWKHKMKSAPFIFKTQDWFGFFGQYGWAPGEVIPISDQARKIGRPMPFFFPWSLLIRFMSTKAKQKMRMMSGYVLLKRSASASQ